MFPQKGNRKGTPAWILGYRDMLFLLLVFFIMLSSISNVDSSKFHGMSNALHGGGRGEPGKHLPSPTGTSKEGITPADFGREVTMIHLVEKLQVVLAPMMKTGDAEVVEQNEGFVLRFKKDALFAHDSLELQKGILPTLQQVANLLSTIANHIEIRGHTDNQPASPNSPYPSNWAVGAGVAATLADFLATKGAVDPARIRVISLGEYSPTISNESEEGRAKNRRVEIMLTRQVMTVTKTVTPESGTAAGGAAASHPPPPGHDSGKKPPAEKH